MVFKKRVLLVAFAGFMCLLAVVGLKKIFCQNSVKAADILPTRMRLEIGPTETFRLGNTAIANVRLTDRAGQGLAGKKIIGVFNEEFRFRKVALTDSNGAASFSFVLNSNQYTDSYDHYLGPTPPRANDFTSSCCKPGIARRPMMYPLKAIFTGDGLYGRREVTGIISIVGSTDPLESGFAPYESSEKKVSGIRGLYNGWDYSNADPAVDSFRSGLDNPPEPTPRPTVFYRDKNGTPLSFNGTAMFNWSGFENKMDEIADKVVNIRSPFSGTMRKKFVMGITPLTSESCPRNATGDPRFDQIDIGHGGAKLPDFHSAAYESAFRQKLFAIAAKWKSDTRYQEAIAGVRVGGGFHEEWGNGPVREGFCSGSEARVASFYGYGSYEDYKGQKWEDLRRKVGEWARQASEANATSDGKKLFFLLESNPYTTPDSNVGWKYNALLALGAGSCFDNYTWLRDCQGTYTHIFPDHFGGLESKYGMFYNGVGGIDPHTEAFLSPGYWQSLAAIKSGIELYDFHSDFWHFFISKPGFDLFTQAHLGTSCDEVGDGAVIFREVADADKKEKECEYRENPADGKWKFLPKPGYEGFSCELYYYGNYDICLYAPKVAGVDFRPLANHSLPGVLRRCQPGDGCADLNKNFLTLARGQSIIIGREETQYQSRMLVSQYAYLDIDEGITSRSPLGRYKIMVVYLDQGTDSFSVDYYPRDAAAPVSLTATKTNTQLFKEVSWVVNDLDIADRFATIDGSLVSADLRLNKQTGDDVFHAVRVVALDLVNDYFDPEPDTCAEWMPNGRSNDHGDANGDSFVNDQDKSIWTTQFRANPCVNSGCYAADFNHDFKVCLSDLEIWRRYR